MSTPGPPAEAGCASTAIVALVTRNGFVESCHHGRVVVLSGGGEPLLSIGDVTAPTLPRSSLKPLQTAGMLRLGLDLPAELVAIACASHSGEDAHLAAVRRLLEHAGLSEADLDNTPGMPLSAPARRALTRADGGPQHILQNCSGKHAAMLATCVVAGWPTAGYRDPAHPLQQSLAATVSDLCGEPVAATTVDGCGAPAYAVSLSGLARGLGRIAAAEPHSPEGRCASAMREHPWLVGGTGRDVTTLITGVPGLLAKDGAEGVYAAALPDGGAVAVKIEDGSSRARMPVLVEALRRLGVAAPPELAIGTVLGHGDPVGEVRATPDLLSASHLGS